MTIMDQPEGRQARGQCEWLAMTDGRAAMLAAILSPA